MKRKKPSKLIPVIRSITLAELWATANKLMTEHPNLAGAPVQLSKSNQLQCGSHTVNLKIPAGVTWK